MASPHTTPLMRVTRLDQPSRINRPAANEYAKPPASQKKLAFHRHIRTWRISPSLIGLCLIVLPLCVEIHADRYAAGCCKRFSLACTASSTA